MHLAQMLTRLPRLQKSDVSSRGLYGLCDKIEKSDLRDGDLVFHHDGTRIVHVGVYVGDGQAIECRGRDYGVVLTKRSGSYWNRFGRWKAFEDLTTSTEPEPGKPVFSRNLKYGSNGADVVNLKKLLIAHGFKTGITVDTKSSPKFGSSTRKMVRAYQKSAGLTVDGIAGKNTITALGGVWYGK